ncbi:MAG: exodeoxyribonuclease VII small subunit [Oscillospiraceae bacterium]|nr:exodeoxyribonuclease VII small subunit [Oscillospiraceae bacterium]
MATKKESAKSPAFEEKMLRLEEIVRALESGSAALDVSLALFEEGAGLVKTCREQLVSAEQKVVRLSKGGDSEPVEEQFALGE